MTGVLSILLMGSLTDAQAAASLGTHEHGVGRLDVALDGTALEIEFDSPAMNLVGFEHLPGDANERAKIDLIRSVLAKPEWLFDLPAAANCQVATQDLHSPLFGNADPTQDSDGDRHAEIHAHYVFTCAHPQGLKNLDLRRLFETFPATQKINVQAIGPSGQHGYTAIATDAQLDL